MGAEGQGEALPQHVRRTGEKSMPQDIVELVEPYRASDSSRWAKLASNVQWRRLVLLLLREIVVELRALRLSTLAPSALAPSASNDDLGPTQGQDQ